MAKAKLAEYKKKRDPKKTPEPFGSTKRGKKPIFVVQRHAARSLHYDFRLERNGALASWAVPKGPPLEPGQQHLAVHVEDHPLEYAHVRGRDPEGPVRRRHRRDLGQGHVRARRGEEGRRPHRPAARRAAQGHVRARPGEALGRPEELADPAQEGRLRRRRRRRPATTGRCSRRLAEDVPHGDWLYEIKWDGYRIVATVAGADASLRTRKDQDYTKRFENVAKELVKAVKTPDCVVDGEVCALDERRAAELLGHAAGQAGDADRLLRLRPARGRRRAAHRPSTRGAAQAAREASRQAEQDGPLLGDLRRRRRAARGGEAAGPRRDHGQAPGLEVPPGKALTRVAQDQGPRPRRSS